jgi:hypothetical protein
VALRPRLAVSKDIFVCASLVGGAVLSRRLRKNEGRNQGLVRMFDEQEETDELPGFRRH